MNGRVVYRVPVWAWRDADVLPVFADDTAVLVDLADANPDLRRLPSLLQDLYCVPASDGQVTS